MSGRVRMGAAKVNITPPVGTHLGGYGNRRQPSDDIHDELYAAAYVFADDTTTVAVIGADLVDFPLERTHSVRRKITALTGIPGSHVMLGATHAHSGPNTKDWGAGLPGASEPFPGGIPTEELTYALPILDLDYLDELENKLAGVVAMAMQGFQNSRWRHRHRAVRPCHQSPRRAQRRSNQLPASRWARRSLAAGAALR